MRRQQLDRFMHAGDLGHALFAAVAMLIQPGVQGVRGVAHKQDIAHHGRMELGPDAHGVDSLIRSFDRSVLRFLAG